MIKTTELDKLKSWSPKTQAIHDFLEFMAEKGYELKKTIPSGWCNPHHQERLNDEELESRINVVRLSDYEMGLISRGERRVVLDRRYEDEFRKALEAMDKVTMAEIVDQHGWEWERGFELDDVGFEGPKFDKFLYEFIDVDPKKIEEERRALLDALSKGKE